MKTAAEVQPAPPRPGTRLWNEVKGVSAELARLRKHLPTLRMDMLHGRMAGAEKDRVLGATARRQAGRAGQHAGDRSRH